MAELKLTPEERARLEQRLRVIDAHYREVRRAVWPTAAVLVLFATLFMVSAWQLSRPLIAVTALSIYALAGWTWKHLQGIRSRRTRLYEDLDLGTKAVLEGPVEAREEVRLRRGREIFHTLTVQQQTFKVKPGDYLRVELDDLVRLYLSPRSRSVLTVERLR